MIELNLNVDPQFHGTFPEMGLPLGPVSEHFRALWRKNHPAGKPRSREAAVSSGGRVIHRQKPGEDNEEKALQVTCEIWWFNGGLMVFDGDLMVVWWWFDGM